MTKWEAPVHPDDPKKLIEALYAALRSKDFDTARYLCHDDYVFLCNAHPEKFDQSMHEVGPEMMAKHLELVDRNWEILTKRYGTPKEQILRFGEPSERGYVYNVTVQLRMRHRLTGEEFEGSKRQEWVIQHGKISAMSQFLDRDQINTIYEMGASR